MKKTPAILPRRKACKGKATPVQKATRQHSPPTPFDFLSQSNNTNGDNDNQFDILIDNRNENVTTNSNHQSPPELLTPFRPRQMAFSATTAPASSPSRPRDNDERYVCTRIHNHNDIYMPQLPLIPLSPVNPQPHRAPFRLPMKRSSPRHHYYFFATSPSTIEPGAVYVPATQSYSSRILEDDFDVEAMENLFLPDFS